jgi:hypothetical protein
MSTKLDRALAHCPRTLGQIITGTFDRGAISGTEGCWIFATESKSGYAKLHIGMTTFPAHKVFYTYFVAPVEEGMHVDHLCRNHSCVNPWHLEAVTPKVNIRRGVIARLGAVRGPSHTSDAMTYRIFGTTRSSAHTLLNRDAA